MASYLIKVLEPAKVVTSFFRGLQRLIACSCIYETCHAAAKHAESHAQYEVALDMNASPVR